MTDIRYALNAGLVLETECFKIESEQLPGTSNDKMLKYLDESRKGSARAAALCNQMLAYADHRPPQKSRIDFVRLVRDTIELLNVSLGKDCELKTDLPATLPEIEADAVQLQQLVMNLIVNAIDALDDQGGVVTIRTGSHYCESAELAAMKFSTDASPGKYVFVEVRDTGCGMTQEEQERAFDPYFTTKGTGRGLGLAALGSVVQDHEGGVVLVSELGKGTSFMIYIRATAPTTLPVADSREAATEGEALNATVLVVDDERAVQDVTKAILDHAGCDVLTANNGYEAVELFHKRHRQIDCIVLDLSMPGMDGEETLAKLRAVAPSVRTLIISGYAREDVLDRIKNDRFTKFIQKPYRRAEFLEIMRKTLSVSSH